MADREVHMADKEMIDPRRAKLEAANAAIPTVNDYIETRRRARRSITPARLYQAIEQAQQRHQLQFDSTIQQLLDAILLEVLHDALEE